MGNKQELDSSQRELRIWLLFTMAINGKEESEMTLAVLGCGMSSLPIYSKSESEQTKI